MRDKRLILIGFFGCLAVNAFAQKTEEPSRSADAAIERFVRECVRITPGKGDFPAEAWITPQRVETDADRPLERVVMKDSFRICRYEITQELYAAVLKNDPSRWKGPRNSVENVSFDHAMEFCRRLTRILHERGLIAENDVVRLPTSVEWEYCCRAGSRGTFCFGNEPGKQGSTDVLDQYAWHTGNAAGNDPAVGVLRGNSWGLHDMHGYLWEFVADPDAGVTDKAKIRGGSWRDRWSLLSCSSYSTVSPDQKGDHIGFRCVIAEKQAEKSAPKR